MRKYVSKYQSIKFWNTIQFQNITPRECTCKAQKCRGLFIPRNEYQIECLWEEHRRINENDLLLIQSKNMLDINNLTKKQEDSLAHIEACNQKMNIMFKQNSLYRNTMRDLFKNYNIIENEDFYSLLIKTENMFRVFMSKDISVINTIKQ